MKTQTRLTERFNSVTMTKLHVYHTNPWCWTSQYSHFQKYTNGHLNILVWSKVSMSHGADYMDKPLHLKWLPHMGCVFVTFLPCNYHMALVSIGCCQLYLYVYCIVMGLSLLGYWFSFLNETVMILTYFDLFIFVGWFIDTHRCCAPNLTHFYRLPLINRHIYF